MNSHDFDQAMRAKAQSEAFSQRPRYELNLSQTLDSLRTTQPSQCLLRPRTFLIAAMLVIALAGAAVASLRLGLVEYLRAQWLTPKSDVSSLLNGPPQQTGGDAVDARFTIEEAFWDGQTLMALVRVVPTDAARFVLLSEGQDMDEFFTFVGGQEKEPLLVSAPSFQQINGSKTDLGDFFSEMRDETGAFTYLLYIPYQAQSGEMTAQVQLRASCVPVLEDVFDWDNEHATTLEFTVPVSSAQQALFKGPYDLGGVQVEQVLLHHTPLGLQVKTTYTTPNRTQVGISLIDEGKASFEFMANIEGMVLPDGRRGWTMSQTFIADRELPAIVDLLFAEEQRVLRLDTKAQTAQVVLITSEEMAALYQGTK